MKYFLIIFSSLISADIKEHQGILATLYVQDSAEYYANSINVYRSAMDKLPSVLSNNNISAAIEQTKDFKDKPPAVVLDVDQTVLDNIAYQARLIKLELIIQRVGMHGAWKNKLIIFPVLKNF